MGAHADRSFELLCARSVRVTLPNFKPFVEVLAELYATISLDRAGSAVGLPL